MKKITLTVEIEVDDDYVLDEPDCLLLDAVVLDEYEYHTSLYKVKE